MSTNRMRKSPEQLWLERTFLLRHRICAEIGADLRSCAAIPVDVPGKSLFGDLAERAIGLSLCDEAPYQDLFRVLGGDRAARLLRSAGYEADESREDTGQTSWQRSDTTPSPLRLFLTAYRLAQANQLLNPQGGEQPDPRTIARLLGRHPQALPFRRGDAKFQWLGFRDLWASYSASFQAALRSYGNATAQVALLGGRRCADLLIGTTVLEVKSGRLDDDRYLAQLIDQMISYTLLAHYDGHPATHVAAYAMRYQRLLRFEGESFLNRLAGRRINIDTASAEFAALISGGRREAT
ncbi:hypothetical protein [Paractinoplanes brasiliensis]|uniref:Uncharacterized protein n=1 Tax=Paractinoplanes brasiliensis TaxID=52695 RepID=A0A4R6JSH6_9ACTN|nr:hypothetical protein [Actinoplanes brasiliensis]TDO39653.1 hypothetical protein C8E87_3348 [Actinoplanes brasiliensis]GID29007.1 hypothetical protein Abr02nite_39900 [Actinoplanes brasiliensis]